LKKYASPIAKRRKRNQRALLGLFIGYAAGRDVLAYKMKKQRAERVPK